MSKCTILPPPHTKLLWLNSYWCLENCSYHLTLTIINTLSLLLMIIDVTLEFISCILNMKFLVLLNDFLFWKSISHIYHNPSIKIWREVYFLPSKRYFQWILRLPPIKRNWLIISGFVRIILNRIGLWKQKIGNPLMLPESCSESSVPTFFFSRINFYCSSSH